MNINLNLVGEFKDKVSESYFQNELWKKNKHYTFLSYFLCCLFFLFAGILGDYQRPFYFGSANDLSVIRIVLLVFSIVFFIVERNSVTRPKFLEWWLGTMKITSTLVILILTIWTKGTSLTLLPGIMMMVGSFFMILPGRIHSTVFCAIILFLTFTFFQEPTATFGFQLHRYMIFMLFAIEVLLLFFKIKSDSLLRREFMTNLNLEEVNLAKDKILATLAHDIRNPLSIIQMRSERSLKRANNINDEMIIKDQNSIMVSIRNIDSLIKELLDWALTELTHGSLVLKSASVKSTIKHAIDFLDESIMDKGIVLKFDAEDCVFEHDPKMLATCVRNIVSNAIKFSPSKSCISVRGMAKDSARYIIEIQDEGNGISHEVMEKILSGSLTISQKGERGEKGVGLGLKLVLNVIKRHRGKMEIESERGKGTTFRLVLPLENLRKNIGLSEIV
ncbi:sensor histidine kinase [Bacteriovorax sp. BSW11_IV]|uniref:sensor histidine kinase n=1 Tax=Bacteriovorax sp. BSW11_IV TaxID=1353529 RepID=UPI00054FAC2B|nr:HAMP domain-containing sensor histidine kinase [Bacteriovorax sp. BSW11_IV]